MNLDFLLREHLYLTQQKFQTALAKSLQERLYDGLPINVPRKLFDEIKCPQLENFFDQKILEKILSRKLPNLDKNTLQSYAAEIVYISKFIQISTQGLDGLLVEYTPDWKGEKEEKKEENAVRKENSHGKKVRFNNRVKVFGGEDQSLIDEEDSEESVGKSLYGFPSLSIASPSPCMPVRSLAIESPWTLSPKLTQSNPEPMEEDAPSEERKEKEQGEGKRHGTLGGNGVFQF